MWEEIFSQGLLSESDSVIVYVPSKELKVEFFREMMALGVAWMGGEQMSERDAVSPYNAFRIICTDREYGIFKLRIRVV